MADPFDDGLDDFDRDLLGHAPMRTLPLNDMPICQQSLGHFPTPASSHFSGRYDGHRPYYGATLLPSPSSEQDPLRRPAMPDARIPNTDAASRGEPTQSTTEPRDTRHAASRPMHYDEPSSRPGWSNTSNLQSPGDLSPTARVSARIQRNAPTSQNRLPPSLDPALPTQPTRCSQTESQSATPVVHGVPLISLRQALPDKFRAIFPYELFNAVQSKCFEVVYRTNDNVVVAAPTGSGKTAILELAICKLALDRGNENFKIVYQAPTKALCSERARDWQKKFGHMNLKCAELTGDTSQAEMRRVGDASIIVTTPEKWDSITRKWQDHRRLLQMVELFLIDEVHILKDARGATLEAVVSRMKTIGVNVRFIALSATVPNSDDISRWLGRNHTNQQLPAHREAFGEEFRPVKLQRFVYGFDSNSNDFIFDRFLDQKLPGLISRHAQQKPILVFCFTRKSCERTAAMLADFAAGRPEGDKLWPVPSQRVPVISRELQEIVQSGVAFHHAGLDVQDRSAVEQSFLNGQLGVVCCTSTLAVGINLPCHTVVLKGTVGFMNDKLEEYSDLEVMQMLGRAGRPQFDDSATAIILTRSANKDRYQRMVSGQEILESTLHLNLIEHLNSEISLGTIHDLQSAKTWLGGTFLSVRLRRNPNYYQLTGGTTSPAQIDDRLEEICERDIKQLQDAGLVADQNAFRCTEYGRAMSKYMVEFHTMKLLLQIPRGAGMENLITSLAQASEFKEFRFKPAERQLFREINQSPLIMYPIKENVTQTRHKVSLMVQAHLGCVQYPDTNDAAKVRRQIMIERKLVFERLNRLVRAVIDCKGHDRDSMATKTALELARGLAAESWEGRATQLTQVPNIGPVGMRKLASKDIRTVLQLAAKDYDEIERLMSRQPPYGRNLQVQLDKFPRLHVEAAVVGYRAQPRSEEPVLIEVKATLRYLNQKGPPHWLGRIPALTFLAEIGNGTLVYFWRGSIKKLDNQAGGFELKFSVGLRDVKDHVDCYFSCEEIVGTIVSTTLDHKLPASAFPIQHTAIEQGFGNTRKKDTQEYLDNDAIDDSDLILATEKAMACSSKKQAAGASSELPLDGYPPVEKLIELSGSQETDAFDNHLAGHMGGREVDSAQLVLREPVRLPNGKWQCNHPCSGGNPTRSGKPCTHRCCKEGLDKPRKRPAQLMKRKKDPHASHLGDTRSFQPAQPRMRQQPQDIAHSPTGGQAKRQKTQGVSSLTQSTLARPFNSSVQEQTKDWNNLDFDDPALDYIDLSFVDDDDDYDDIFRSLATSPSTTKGRDLTGKSTHTNPVTLKSRVNNTLQRATDSPGQAKCATQISGQGSLWPSSGQQDDYPDDDTHNDVVSFEQEGFPKHNGSAARHTANAFKSGANDEALYQGISKKFAETINGAQHCENDGDVAITPSWASKSGNSSPPARTDDLPEMISDQSPSSSTVIEPIVSPMERSIPVDNASAETRPAKESNEPAWVAEFDQEFVDMFRGYVKFV